jgi:hypothetical protein
MFMTQAHPNQSKPLGVQAAAAATSNAAKPDDKKATDAKAADAKPTDAKPDDKKADVVADSAADDADDKKSRVSRKVYVVVGQVHEFDSVNKAEKFLNADGAPAEYSVLRGNRIGTSKKVSLR